MPLRRYAGRTNILEVGPRLASQLDWKPEEAKRPVGVPLGHRHSDQAASRESVAADVPPRTATAFRARLECGEFTDVSRIRAHSSGTAGRMVSIESSYGAAGLALEASPRPAGIWSRRRRSRDATHR